MDEEEVALNSSTNYQNNGHITMTQLKGDRGFSTYLTASVFKPQTLTYEVHADGQTSTSTRTVSFNIISLICFIFSPYYLIYITSRCDVNTIFTFFLLRVQLNNQDNIN